MPRYQYQPIVDKAREIRVLTLLPRSSSSIFSREKIHILLHHVNLDEESVPDYEALSYVWGSAENSVTIYVGRKKEFTFAVTRHLAIALSHLQHKTKTLTFWIDAICIDQQNLQERSQQVTRMADIFRLAPRVTAWLGPGDEPSKEALALLADISQKVDVDWTRFTMTPSEVARISGEEEWADLTVDLPYSDKVRDCIISLLSRSWFKRLWIRQEIWLSQHKANLVCGNDAISWADFRTSIICLYLKSGTLDDERLTMWNTVIPRTYELCAFEQFYSWASLLNTIREAECSDPKDKVYAILSLVPEAESLNIQPDYTMTHLEVYKDMVLHYLDRRQDLDVLCCCHLNDKDPELPSWVPNLERKSSTQLMIDYIASGNSASCARLVDEWTIKVTGRCVATVSRSQMIADHDLYTYGRVSEVIRKLAPSDLNGTFVGGGNTFDAYCRAVSGARANFFEPHWPPDPHLPGPEVGGPKVGIILNKKILDRSRSFSDILSGLLPDELRYMDNVYGSLGGRQFITTNEGYMGVGPPAAQVGDRVCVLLGLNNLILLRPHASQVDRHEILGEAKIHGLMYGEGLLGPLPEPYEATWTIDPSNGMNYLGFFNTENKRWQTDDPRLGQLPQRWTKAEHEVSAFWNIYLNEKTGEKTFRDPRMTVEELTKRGVDLEEFYLV